MLVRFPFLTPPKGSFSAVDEYLRQVAEPAILCNFLALFPRAVDEHDAPVRVGQRRWRRDCCGGEIAKDMPQSSRSLSWVEQHHFIFAIFRDVRVGKYLHISRAYNRRMNSSALKRCVRVKDE